MENATYLGNLIGKKKKREELTQLIAEVCINLPYVSHCGSLFTDAKYDKSHTL